MEYSEVPVLEENKKPDDLEGEHQANDVLGNVDWEALYRNSETLTMRKVKNNANKRSSN
jgi:hypothetical protein